MDTIYSLFLDVLAIVAFNFIAAILYLVGLRKIKQRKARWGWYIGGTAWSLCILIGFLAGVARRPELYLTPYNIFIHSSGLVFACLFFFITKRAIHKSTVAIPVVKLTDDSKEPEMPVFEPLKPKSRFFDRYDTYIVCPGCGSMVAKGTKNCDCGYDLSGPISRLIRKAAPILLGLLICAGIGIAGFFLGQRSMDGKLLDQYLIGYDEGLTVGYDAGTAEAEANYPEVFEDGYRTGISNYVTDSYGMTNFATETWRFDFDGRDELNCSLGEEYDFRKYNEADRNSGGTLIPTNPFLK